MHCVHRAVHDVVPPAADIIRRALPVIDDDGDLPRQTPRTRRLPRSRRFSQRFEIYCFRTFRCHCEPSIAPGHDPSLDLSSSANEPRARRLVLWSVARGRLMTVAHHHSFEPRESLSAGTAMVIRTASSRYGEKTVDAGISYRRTSSSIGATIPADRLRRRVVCQLGRHLRDRCRDRRRSVRRACDARTQHCRNLTSVSLTLIAYRHRCGRAWACARHVRRAERRMSDWRRHCLKAHESERQHRQARPDISQQIQQYRRLTFQIADHDGLAQCRHRADHRISHWRLPSRWMMPAPRNDCGRLSSVREQSNRAVVTRRPSTMAATTACLRRPNAARGRHIVGRSTAHFRCGTRPSKVSTACIAHASQPTSARFAPA